MNISAEVAFLGLAKKDIKSMTLEEFMADFSGISSQKYRAKQIYQWIAKGIKSFDEMSNVPKLLRDKLSQIYEIPGFEIQDKRVSVDSTVKYLFKLHDGECIESVVMKYKHGYSICVSTQAGCKMGCVFCQTGKGGFSRNLLPSEMILQIETAQRDLNIKISNIVLMGMGEPLDNYENVVKFLKLVSAPEGLNIGMRHISLSTCGVVDKIYDLAKENFQLTLSVSLHAPNDSIRDRIMKINRRWNVEELMKACLHYSKVCGRRISFEYVMIKGVNDSVKSASELADILKGMLCHVNLIPLNGNLSNGMEKSLKTDVYRFKNVLESKGITATVRRTLAQDIEGACGQLKGVHIPKEVKSKNEIL